MSKKVVIISQDYDGCFSIMTDVGITREMRLNHVFWEKTPPYGQAIHPMLAAARQKFDDYLSAMTERADEVRVYVGSDRQSFEMDQHNAQHNQNGSVFPALRQLCEDRNTAEKPWIFESLLMSDPLDYTQGRFGRVRGLSLACMTDTPAAVQYSVVDPHRCGRSKVSMLLNQMWDASRQNPDATELEFHFIDDREDLIVDVLRNIRPDQLPPNMTLSVTKFDYVGLIQQEAGALALRSPIIGALSPNQGLPMLGIFATTGKSREMAGDLPFPGF